MLKNKFEKSFLLSVFALLTFFCAQSFAVETVSPFGVHPTIVCAPAFHPMGQVTLVRVVFDRAMYSAELTLGDPSFGDPVRTQSYDVKDESTHGVGQLLMEGARFELRIDEQTSLGAVKAQFGGKQTSLQDLKCQIAS